MYTEESSSTYKRTLEDITVIFKLFLHGLKLPLDSESQEVSVSDRHEFLFQQTLGISLEMLF